MIWAGKTVLIQWAYAPKTTLAVKWKHISNGDWVGSDRTSNEDVYETRVVFKGPRNELIDLETNVLAAFRDEFQISCNSGEEIFGADIDYTNNLRVTVVQYSKPKQVSFSSWTMPLTLRLFEPTFKSDTPDFTKLRLSSFASEQGSEFDINKAFTYDNYPVYSDHDTEPGIFQGNFTQTAKEMPAIRRYIAVTARANNIAFPSFGGITTPFGTREGVGPFTVRLIDWSDIGRVNFTDWKLKLKFARVYKL